MQLDGRYFLSICSESEGKVEANLIQTRMNTSQFKTKLQVGIKLVDVSKTYKFESYWSTPICLPSYFSSLSWSWSISFSHFFHPDHCAWLAGHFKEFFGIDDGNYCASEQHTSTQQKFFEFHSTRKLHAHLCNCMKTSWTTSCSIMLVDVLR
jgi:hypothetical protein